MYNNFFTTVRGGSRYVILIGNLAIKFPYLRFPYHGRKQNLKEWEYRNKSSHLAKLYISFPFGWCNVMERVQPLAKSLSSVDCTNLIRAYFKNKVTGDELAFLLEDSTLENFGTKNGRIVKLDWGGFWRSESM